MAPSHPVGLGHCTSALLGREWNAPNDAMVPPCLVMTAQDPMFCLASEFWTAAAKKPTAPPARTPSSPDLTASREWKGCSSGRAGLGNGFAILEAEGGGRN